MHIETETVTSPTLLNLDDDEDVEEHDEILDSYCRHAKRDIHNHIIAVKKRLLTEKQKALDQAEEEHQIEYNTCQNEIRQLKQKISDMQSRLESKNKDYQTVTYKAAEIMRNNHLRYRSQQSLKRTFQGWQRFIALSKQTSRMDVLSEKISKFSLKARTFLTLFLNFQQRKNLKQSLESKFKFDSVTTQIISKYELELQRMREDVKEAYDCAGLEQRKRLQLEEDLRRMFLKNMTTMNMEALNLFHGSRANNVQGINPDLTEQMGNIDGNNSLNNTFLTTGTPSWVAHTPMRERPEEVVRTPAYVETKTMAEEQPGMFIYQNLKQQEEDSRNRFYGERSDSYIDLPSPAFIPPKPTSFSQPPPNYPQSQIQQQRPISSTTKVYQPTNQPTSSTYATNQPPSSTYATSQPSSSTYATRTFMGMPDSDAQPRSSLSVSAHPSVSSLGIRNPSVSNMSHISTASSRKRGNRENELDSGTPTGIGLTNHMNRIAEIHQHSFSATDHLAHNTMNEFVDSDLSGLNEMPKRTPLQGKGYKVVFGTSTPLEPPTSVASSRLDISHQSVNSSFMRKK